VDRDGVAQGMIGRARERFEAVRECVHAWWQR
jgi:hypothetical protein